MKKIFTLILVSFLSFQLASAQAPKDTAKKAPAVTLNYKKDMFYNMLGQKKTSKSVKAFMKKLGQPTDTTLADPFSFYSWDNKGAELDFKGNGVSDTLTSITLKVNPDKGQKDTLLYTGQLPFGLSRTMTRTAVENIIGQPLKNDTRSDNVYIYQTGDHTLTIIYTGLGGMDVRIRELIYDK